MAQKGDKAKLYDVAMKMYIDGHSMTDVADALGVSRQALSQWKADSKAPSDDMDAWDRARKQKSTGIQRLRDLFSRQLEYVETLTPANVSPPMMDTLSKLGALVERWDRVEKEIRAQATAQAADAVETEARKQGTSAETIDALRAAIMKEMSR
jgi:transcriptional regulator with XRE-family HTH domain